MSGENEGNPLKMNKEEYDKYITKLLENLISIFAIISAVIIIIACVVSR